MVEEYEPPLGAGLSRIGVPSRKREQGGVEGDRTPSLVGANHALFQLSYNP